MHQRLLELLQYFSTAEISSFKQLLGAPFFNENERLVTLFEFIQQFAPKYEAPNLNAEAAFAFLFPAEAFDKKVVHRLNSQLYKLAEQFVALEMIKKNTFQRDLHLLRYYEDALLSRHFESTLHRLRGVLEVQNVQEPAFFKYQLELESVYAEYLSKRDQRTGDINLQALNNSLDVFFLLNKLMLLSQMASRQLFVKIPYDFTWINEILAYLESSSYTQIPMINLYRNVLLLQLYPAERERYFALRQLLEQYHSLLPKEDLRSFYAYLENAAKHVFQVGEYFQALFDLYNAQIAQGILYHKGFISHTVFRNVVNAALNVNELQWAEAFIQQYGHYIIPEEYRKDTYWQNLAMLHFYKKDFAQAQQCLLQSNPVDIYYKLADKSLLARIYYEQRETEVLDNFLNTFTKFVFDQQKKIAAAKVQSYRTFINFFRALFKKINSDPAILLAFENKEKVGTRAAKNSLKKLHEQIEATPLFYGKKWLSEKLEELF